MSYPPLRKASVVLKTAKLLLQSPMPLKLERLSVNDIEELPQKPKEEVEPTNKQICDDVVLLWRQEPASEDLGISKLHTKIKDRNTQWVISERKLKQVLTDHNLHFTDESKLFTYADQVTALECPQIDPAHLNKIELRKVGPARSFSVFATKNLKRDELVFYEHEALTPILPLEKISLAKVGRACALCGQSLTQSSHFTMKNGLDCQMCSAIWCSKHCKKYDTTHAFLKHATSRNKQVSATGWLEFEHFCRENVLHAGYSVGVIYSRSLLDKNEGSRIKAQFEALAQVSQNLRIKAADSTNIGGTFDLSTGAVGIDDTSTWSRSYDLFCEAFPGAKNDGLDLDTYLKYIGKFNINQLEGQIYTVYSHLNHNCEPNVRYEFDGKIGLKLFARKDIKKGEELFTTYVNPLHGVTLRRRELLVNWGFLCKCDRCKKELAAREKSRSSLSPLNSADANSSSRRKSSMKASRPDLSELLKNGQEFNLEIPEELGSGRRRKSVRFDNKVMAAFEE